MLNAANDNDPAQVVISGARAAVERAVDMAKGKGAKRALLLPVSAPFHCALMAPAAEVMAEALAAVDIAAPKVPLVANVLAAPIDTPDADRLSGRGAARGGSGRFRGSGGRQGAERDDPTDRARQRCARHQHTGRCDGDEGVGKCLI